MNKKILLLSIIGLSACSPEPTAVIRIDCGAHNNQDLQIEVNGNPSGICPLDVIVHAGDLVVTARKDNEDASYLFAETKVTLAVNGMKRIKLDVNTMFTEEYYFRNATNLSGMVLYLKELPDGKRRSEIDDKLEQYYFNRATDVAGMTLYLEMLPNGRRRNEVSESLKLLNFDKATQIVGMEANSEDKRHGKSIADIKTEAAKLDGIAPRLDMVEIPSGRFMMGCSDGDSECSEYEKPQHEVLVAAFKLSKTEVTFDEYDPFAKATKRELPKDEGWGRGNRPVINVTWDDAVAYTKWLSEQTGQKFRLPSEVEWEYAARAGSVTKYSWGNSIECSQARYDSGENSSCEQKNQNGKLLGTAPVASFAANSFGLHDMHGNVYEWVQDCWNSSYENSPKTSVVWQRGDCEKRVLRGGAWNFGSAQLRTSSRYFGVTFFRKDNRGFRVAQS